MVAIKDKLQVKILEHNNEILETLIQDICVHLKSDEDIALVRFDAYADFLVPKNIKADEIETSDKFFDLINNRCWILPAVYRGYVKKIFWFKPPWAHQFQDGQYQLQVGKCQQTGLLKIFSTIPYFISNCVYSSIDKLVNIHTVDIYVSTAGLAKNYSTTIEKPHPPIYDNESGSESLDSDNRKKMKLSSNDINHKDGTTSTRIYPLDATIIDNLLETRKFFIDIDLSFFSTDDYIRKQFDENEYEILRYVYTRIPQDHSDVEIKRYLTNRETALEQIRMGMDEYLTETRIDHAIHVENPYLAALISIIRYKKLDWKMIHNYGTHLTDTRPPLHVSSEEMVIYLNEAMAKILQSIKKDPVYITISRCVDDGFCSLEQADLIQKYIEKKIRNLYKIDEIIGKSLIKFDDNDNEIDNEDEDNNESESKYRKTLVISDDENSRSSSISANDRSKIGLHNNNNNNNNNNISSNQTMSTIKENDSILSSQIKSNLSPGETTRAMSPSSLSETSPLLD